MAPDKRRGAAPRRTSILLATHHLQLRWASHKGPANLPCTGSMWK